MRAPLLLFSASLVSRLAATVWLRLSARPSERREGEGRGSVFCLRVCSFARGMISQPEWVGWVSYRG